MKPDEILKKNGGLSKIRTDLIGDENEKYFLISGSEDSLILLSDLIRSIAKSNVRKIYIGPKGPGAINFLDNCDFGIYIERV
jgi:tetrahydromethanopterin S-methyltransferase subunit A